MEVVKFPELFRKSKIEAVIAFNLNQLVISNTIFISNF